MKKNHFLIEFPLSKAKQNDVILRSCFLEEHENSFFIYQISKEKRFLFNFRSRRHFHVKWKNILLEKDKKLAHNNNINNINNGIAVYF